MESKSECAGSSAERMRLESPTGVSGENQQVTPSIDTPRYIQCVYVYVCVWGGGVVSNVLASMVYCVLK